MGAKGGDATRTFSDSDLRKELEERIAADQEARREYLARLTILPSSFAWLSWMQRICCG
jgi:hypothetical protein